MTETVEELRRKLIARDKTIAALMKRVEGASTQQSAFATFEENIRLESVVARKTEELRAAQERLLHEMDVQRTLEVELRQAQKLEAVGRLAAGVAHEINTPIQYVSDSLEFIRQSAEDLARFVERANQMCAAVQRGEDAGHHALECERLAQEADLAYSLENVGPSIRRATDGLTRVANIVRALKRFAHPGADQMTAADLNDALASTLTIAANEYKYVADVVTDYGAIDPVSCRIGELNQAFLNIIVNAAHAIADKVGDSGARGTITVRTRQQGEFAEVTIEDTGGGIPEAIRERVFDPFFTTKEVGRGTGQGLAIVRSVVRDMHRGEVSFLSEAGRGTAFVLKLPLRPEAAAA